MVHSLPSVSYTHLDVYKRQAQAREGRQPPRGEEEALHYHPRGAPRLSPVRRRRRVRLSDPVSYTHLDVYKRQFLNRQKWPY